MASKQMLTEVCRKHGLLVTGNKDELWERILKEEHLSEAIQKTLLACPAKKKKKKETSPLAQKTIVKHKTLPYEQFCDQTRPLLVAGGMTDKASIAKKLAEMYKTTKPKAVNVQPGSPVGALLSAAPAFALPPPAAPVPIFNPETVPNNMLLTLNVVAPEYASIAGLVFLSKGRLADGRPAWLYAKSIASSSSSALNLE
jgi:hypothetical protein